MLPRAAQVGLLPCLTPHGHLVLVSYADEPPLDDERLLALTEAFSQGGAHGLLFLVSDAAGSTWPPAFAFWRAFAGRFLTAVCARPRTEMDPGFHAPEPPGEDELALLAHSAPLMPGAEYLTVDTLHVLWKELGEVFTARLRASGDPLDAFLKRIAPGWNLVGRVHFNLAENRADPETPFAFMATYTGRLSVHGKAQHQPLGQALNEFAGKANTERLLSLLLPVKRAAERCTWLKPLVEEGAIYHPLRWTPGEAMQLLRDTHELEQAGVMVRLPAAWKTGRPARPKVNGTIGSKEPSRVGANALLDFRMSVSLDGESLTDGEVAALLAGSDGLAYIRGQWVEVDPERLQRTMSRFEQAQQLAQRDGLTFAEAMRMLAGAGIAEGAEDQETIADWADTTAGPWLGELLRGLRSPEGLATVDPGSALRGTLRPYQQTGLRWLHLLSHLGLGACLADDMGLGKTIQVLSLLLVRKRENKSAVPSLLVAPASLLANWAAEIDRFAPGLRKRIAHPSAMPGDEWRSLDAHKLKGVDLVITSYGTLLRAPWIESTTWDLVIIDEAQAIKNPGTKQTKAVKKVKAHARIALTGTPVENRLTDLWSLFDFVNPGLLGSSKQFSAYAKGLASGTNASYAPLRELVRPYILRRMKTDRSIISDLPDKTEMKAYCQLSAKQAALYQKAVDELAGKLQEVDGIQRRGLVLSFLMRFKQICNHPSQWLGDNTWAEEASGKWARLRAIAETVASKQEKMLLFTQFRETTGPLAAFLGELFGRPGLVLHGDTPVKQRGELVKRFQNEDTLPFFVLSLKAGGSGLNLTAASHVVHFDRWWNPAVEDQATDRAFRIGQKRNVLIHKFICKGTVEDHIDELIDSKQKLSRALLQGGAELDITGLKDDELLKLFALDLSAATND
ncbi:MAG: DEAD/DEAH box helicase [Bacteroidetes bacterium]|nr:DEAD/DEAH box helicase [Bacteroidota bacterium]